VYDVARRETFTNLSDVWAKEAELYSTTPECIKMLVGNKVDRVSLACVHFCAFTMVISSSDDFGASFKHLLEFFEPYCKFLPFCSYRQVLTAQLH